MTGKNVEGREDFYITILKYSCIIQNINAA